MNRKSKKIVATVLSLTILSTTFPADCSWGINEIFSNINSDVVSAEEPEPEPEQVPETDPTPEPENELVTITESISFDSTSEFEFRGTLSLTVSEIKDFTAPEPDTGTDHTYTITNKGDLVCFSVKNGNAITITDDTSTIVTPVTIGNDNTTYYFFQANASETYTVTATATDNTPTITFYDVVASAVVTGINEDITDISDYVVPETVSGKIGDEITLNFTIDAVNATLNNEIIFIPSSISLGNEFNVGSGMAIVYEKNEDGANVSEIKYSNSGCLTIPSKFTVGDNDVKITGFGENILAQDKLLTVLFESNDNSIAESLITAGADVVCLYGLTDEGMISFNHITYSVGSYENNDEFRKNYKFESKYNVFGVDYTLAKLPENIGSVQNHTHIYEGDNENNTETCTICGLKYSNGFTTTGVYDPDNEYYGYVTTNAETNETVVHALFDKPEIKENKVYQISNAGELYWFAAHVNAQIKDENGTAVEYNAELTSDIDLLDGIPKGLQWTPIYNKVTSSHRTGYAGVFNGNGHKISGLNISGTEELVGLFGKTNNSEIKNVAIVESKIIIKENVNYCGSFVAHATNTSFENVYSHLDIEIEDIDKFPEDYSYSGLCGHGSSITIENAYSYFVNEQSEYISPICQGDATCKNVYYINSVKRENDPDGKVIDTEYTSTKRIKGIAKTAKEFESGHVAWLLQDKDACEKEGVKFSQKIEGDNVEATPVLAIGNDINLVYDYDEYNTCYVSANPENKSTKYTNTPGSSEFNKYDFQKGYSDDTAETIKPNIYSCTEEHVHEIKDEDGIATTSLICLNKDEGEYTGKCTHLLDTNEDENEDGDGENLVEYVVSNAEELKAVMDMLNGETDTDLNEDGIINEAPKDTSNICITLAADIEVDSETPWVPISSFAGEFKGEGHVIKNMKISSDSEYVGFFKELTGSVSWLGLEGCSFTAGNNSTYIGGIAGKLGEGGTISNCYTADLKMTGADQKGGIVGHNSGSIEKCHSYTEGIKIVDENATNGDNVNVENCYYLVTLKDESNDDHTKGIQATAEEFGSGKITFHLADEESTAPDSSSGSDEEEESELKWCQNLKPYFVEVEGTETEVLADEYPVFKQVDGEEEENENDATVYKYYEHGSNVVEYTNDPEGKHTDAHIEGNSDYDHNRKYEIIGVYNGAEAEDLLESYRPNENGHYEKCSVCGDIKKNESGGYACEPHTFETWEIDVDEGVHKSTCACGYSTSHPMDKNGQYISTADYHFPLFGCSHDNGCNIDASFLSPDWITDIRDLGNYKHDPSDSYVYKDENTHLATCNICKSTFERPHDEDGSCCGISYGGFIENFNPDIVSEERVAFKFHYVPEGDYKFVSYGMFYSNDGTPLSEDFEQNKKDVDGKTIKSHTKVVESGITSMTFTAKILDKGKSIYAMPYMTLADSSGKEIVVSGDLVVFENNIEDMDRVQEDVKISISNIKSIYDSSSSNPYRISFPVTRKIPDEYTFVNYGIIYSNNGTEITNNTTLDDVDKTNIKSGSKNDYKNGTFTANIGANFENAVYLRGYVTVKDKYGNTHIVYSDVVSRKYGVDIGFSSIESVYDTKERIAFAFTREISGDFEMVNYGIIYSNNGTEITNADTLASVDGTNIKKGTRTDYKNGTFTANIAVNGDNAVYIRGYVTLKDKSGNEFTVYTDAETATYTG